MTRSSFLLQTTGAILVSLVAVALWFGATSVPAHALSCIQPGTTAEELAAADAVLYGEITKVLSNGGVSTSSGGLIGVVSAATATVAVNEWFKGDMGDEIELTLGTYATWYSFPTKGQEVILYLQEPQNGEMLYMPLCGRSVVGNVASELKALKEVTGNTTPTPQGEACHVYGASGRAPQGFGLAYNPNTMKLILKASCDDAGVTLMSVPGRTGLTYKYGYYYDDDKWNRYEYTNDGRVRGTRWFEGTSSYELDMTIAEPGETLYFVTFTCDWDGRNWHCGCTDKACDDPHWQVQQVKVPIDTDNLTACTADAMQCPDGTWVGRTGPNCEFVCP